MNNSKLCGNIFEARNIFSKRFHTFKVKIEKLSFNQKLFVSMYSVFQKKELSCFIMFDTSNKINIFHNELLTHIICVRFDPEILLFLRNFIQTSRFVQIRSKFRVRIIYIDLHIQWVCRGAFVFAFHLYIQGLGGGGGFAFAFHLKI